VDTGSSIHAGLRQVPEVEDYRPVYLPMAYAGQHSIPSDEHDDLSHRPDAHALQRLGE
jgi:hypothetical protein